MAETVLDATAAGGVDQATTGVATVVPGINARGGSLNSENKSAIVLGCEKRFDLPYSVDLDLAARGVKDTVCPFRHRRR